MDINKDENLSTFIYRYMEQYEYEYENENEITPENQHYKNEKKIDMDNDFKEDLKKHFKSLSLMDKNDMECDISKSNAK